MIDIATRWLFIAAASFVVGYACALYLVMLFIDLIFNCVIGGLRFMTGVKKWLRKKL